MTDLVSRLRERHSFLCDEAAEEIERLHGIIADNSLLNRTDNERLRGLLGEAADDIEHWGGYASEYFKDKWHLEDDIKKYRDAALAGAAVQPSAAHAFCGPFPEQSEDERTLRFLLALRCGEPGELYGDDGELQLGGFPHPIDFRRDSVQEIRRKLDARGMAKLIEQQRRAADPTTDAIK